MHFGALCVGVAGLAIGDHCTVIIVQNLTNYSISSKLLLNIEKALEHSTKLKDDT